MNKLFWENILTLVIEFMTETNNGIFLAVKNHNNNNNEISVKHHHLDRNFFPNEICFTEIEINSGKTACHDSLNLGRACFFLF